MDGLRSLFREYGKTALMTFEIFWILVFVLSAIANQAGPEIAAFVYVNF